MRLPVLFLASLAALTIAGEAQAHRLIVDYHVLPGGKVQIESWFDRGGTPRSAAVEVFGEADQLRAKGALDKRGIFVFKVERVEPLRVVVFTVDHRAQTTISERELARAWPDNTLSNNPGTEVPNGDPPAPLSDRSSRVSVTDVVAGVGLLLAVAAFWMSWRNARRLREFRDTEMKTG